MTSLASTARERLAGLGDRGSVTMDIFIDEDGPGQVALRKAVGATAKAMKVVRGDGKSFAVMVAWNNFGDSLRRGCRALRTGVRLINTAYAWFA